MLVTVRTYLMARKVSSLDTPFLPPSPPSLPSSSSLALPIPMLLHHHPYPRSPSKTHFFSHAESLFPAHTPPLSPSPFLLPPSCCYQVSSLTVRGTRWRCRGGTLRRAVPSCCTSLRTCGCPAPPAALAPSHDPHHRSAHSQAEPAVARDVIGTTGAEAGQQQ